MPPPDGRSITTDVAVVAIGTPGHTQHHISVAVRQGEAIVLIAGDASYTERLMLDEKVDGVSPNETMARTTLARIRDLATRERPVYLPTRDPASASRLTEMRRALPNAPASGAARS